uniref:GntR family transcriptional regulator n=1 Tax=OCS116 cluster bacterium TaxID=2030921 RepID=A0A2A4Z0E2_9PROT
MFKPVNTARAFEIISEQIRLEIESKRLRPGDKLPPERELAVQFGVSRNAVREALRNLESAGVIGMQKGVHGGAFVQKGGYDGVTQSIRDMLSLGRITLNNLTEARLEIMGVVLRLAAARATDEDFNKLDRNLEDSRLAIVEKRHEDQMKLTADFYYLLAKSTQNFAMVLLTTPMAEVVHRFVTAAEIQATESVIASRSELLGHLRNRDSDKAVENMSAHLKTVHEAILRRFPDGTIPVVEV